MDIIIASNNLHKVDEIKQILGDKFDNIYTLNDKNIDIDIVEDGKTFYENALLKAMTIANMTGMAALADDSGLEVLALDNQPGVHSARYAGEPCDDIANNKLLLSNMSDITDRRANFTSCVVIVLEDKSIVSASGKAYGQILIKPVGDKGFGYDPLFLSDDLGVTFAQADSEMKNTCSHRKRALTALCEKLDEKLKA